MSKRYKIASGFAPFSPCVDRFNVTGYREPMSLEQQFEAASRIEGFGGVGLDYPYQFTDPQEVKPLLKKYGLAFVTLEIGLYPDRKWKNGTYTAPDPGIRREAISMSKKALDVAADLGAVDVLMWPGQDGFDYPFQSDYAKYWTLLVDAIGEVASHRPDVKIAIEYKKQEPRANCYIRNAGVLLAMLAELGMENVGGCIDLGPPCSCTGPESSSRSTSTTTTATGTTTSSLEACLSGRPSSFSTGSRAAAGTGGTSWTSSPTASTAAAPFSRAWTGPSASSSWPRRSRPAAFRAAWSGPMSWPRERSFGAGCSGETRSSSCVGGVR
jgi:hypothetical protein